MRKLIFQLLYKDIKVFFSDKKSTIILILMPIILMTILGYAVGGMMKDDINPIKVALVKNYEAKKNESISELNINSVDEAIKKSKSLINTEDVFFEGFLDKHEIKKWIEYKVVDEKKAKELYDKGNVDGILIINQDFYDNLPKTLMGLYNKNIELNLFIDASNSKALILKEILYEFTDTVSYIGIANKESLKTLLKEKKYSEISKALSNNPRNINDIVNSVKEKIDEKNVSESKRKVDGLSYYAIGMMGMFMLYGVTSSSRTLLKEKQNGTLGRVLMSGIDIKDILISKFIFSVLVTLYQFLIMTIFGSLVLKISYGDFYAYFITLLISALSLGAISLFLLILTIKANSFNLINTVESVFVQILSLLGGSMLPVEKFPIFVQKISDYIINGVFIKTLLEISGGADITSIKGNLFIILINGLIFFVVSIILLKSLEVFDVNRKN